MYSSKNQYACDFTKIACYDTRWKVVPGFKIKVFNLWIGILHFINFITLLSLSISENTLTVQQTITDISLTPIGTVPIGIIVLIWVGLTALYHISYELIVCFKDKYGLYDNIERHHNPYRWIHYSITNTLWLFSISVLSGVSDINFLLIFCVFHISSCLFINYIEKHGGLEFYALSMFLSLIPWVFIIRQAILVNVNKFIATSIAFGILNQLMIDVIIIKWFSPNYYMYEISFAVLDFCCKTITSWLIFSSFL